MRNYWIGSFVAQSFRQHSKLSNAIKRSNSEGLLTTTARLFATDATVTSFEPVLNLPAFFAFAIIAAVFGLLQWRVTQIEQAVEDRQEALEALRSEKAAQLSNGDDNGRVEEATEAYTSAYWKVERLRTLAPGIRIRAPTENQANSRGAQQFLGIEPPAPEEEGAAGNTIAPTVAAVLLGFIALTQIGLLLLFATDPLNAVNTLEGSVRSSL